MPRVVEDALAMMAVHVDDIKTAPAEEVARVMDGAFDLPPSLKVSS